MKKTIGAAMAVACVASAGTAHAQSRIDTAKIQSISEVVVKAVRAPKNAPFAVANIKKSELRQFATTGQELPFLFSRTPGVLAWSENGVGTGTAYMRMRGAGGSRINVTLDGVPLNSPEDQTVFWANMNSYASLLGSVQIQRGIGTSTNGDGAFGGSISLATAAPTTVPYVELTGSYGSFNTWNTGVNFSANLVGNSLILDGAYHETNTDGFIHGTSGRSGSYYGGLTWLGGNFKLSYKNIGNFEKTGQAWNGVAACNYDGDTGLGDYGIRSYGDMYKRGLGRYNSLMEDLVFPSTPDGDFTTKSFYLRDGRKWNQTTDNFYQNHNILNFTWQPSAHWSHVAAIHYTYGYGYYSEFRRATELGKKFGLNVYDEDGNLVKSEAVRKKGLTQNNYGALYNVHYKDGAWDVIGGINAQLFRCNHWGYLTYIANEQVEREYMKNGKYTYYDSDAKKNDYSWFAKANYNFAPGWNVFADMQMRIVNYTTDGLNDKFVKGKKDGRKFYTQQRLDIDKTYTFYNPKAGISYARGGHKAYASVAYANREPERNNFTDNGSAAAPKAEHLFDVEAGYQYRGENWYASANFYYMRYINQFVMTGAKSDIGESITSNIRNSYRMGAELSAGWTPVRWLSFEGNAALSQNKLRNFTEEVESWDGDGDPVHFTYDKSTLSFSPSAILNGFVDLRFGGFTATWHTNFVSRQYLDNTESLERSLPSYTQTNVRFNYTTGVKKALGLKAITLGLDLNNIFDSHYAASGYVYYDWVYKGKRSSTLAYIPMAGFNCMGHVTLKF